MTNANKGIKFRANSFKKVWAVNVENLESQNKKLVQNMQVSGIKNDVKDVNTPLKCFFKIVEN